MKKNRYSIRSVKTETALEEERRIEVEELRARQKNTEIILEEQTQRQHCTNKDRSSMRKQRQIQHYKNKDIGSIIRTKTETAL